jgi:outer membrane protein assembly factor BamB
MTRLPILILIILCSTLLILTNVFEVSATTTYSWSTFQGNALRNGYTESPAPNSNQTFWKFQTGGPIISSPVVANSIVFISSTDGFLYAVNSTTGTNIWRTEIGENINSPTVGLGKVFITSKSGNVYAFDIHTGSQLWSRSLKEEIGSGSPLLVGSRVFVNTNQSIFFLK